MNTGSYSSSDASSSRLQAQSLSSRVDNASREAAIVTHALASRE